MDREKAFGGNSFFIGVGGLFGGGLALWDPTGEKKGNLAENALKLGPFHSFFIPGLFLLLVIGGGNLLALLLLVRKHPSAPLFSLGIGAVLCLWILIQCVIMQTVLGLHVGTFAAGIFMMILSFGLMRSAKVKTR